MCPGPVASEIARKAPWPLNVIVVAGMRWAFPDPIEAALAVLNLADGGDQSSNGEAGNGGRGEDTSQVHWHMAEPREAGMHADDPVVGAWLWDKTEALLKERKPPVV